MLAPDYLSFSDRFNSSQHMQKVFKKFEDRSFSTNRLRDILSGGYINRQSFKPKYADSIKPKMAKFQTNYNQSNNNRTHHKTADLFFDKDKKKWLPRKSFKYNFEQNQKYQKQNLKVAYNHNYKFRKPRFFKYIHKSWKFEKEEIRRGWEITFRYSPWRQRSITKTWSDWNKKRIIFKKKKKIAYLRTTSTKDNNKGWHSWKFYSTLRKHKRLFFCEWLRIANWRNKAYDLGDRIDGKKIPYKFRVKKPWFFFKLSKWDYKFNKWLNPILYTRGLLLLNSFLRFQRFKNQKRTKKNKVYKWLNHTLYNRWRWGFKRRAFFRVKQLLFGKILLPYYGNLTKKQFVKIRRHTSRIKPLSIQNSRPALFLSKFERRLDILSYRLNFAPTIQWGRNFVAFGLIYVSSIHNHKSKNWITCLTKHQKFPLLKQLLKKTKRYFKPDSQVYTSREVATIFRRAFDLPLPVTAINHLVNKKTLVHWSSHNIRSFFFSKLHRKKVPSYFFLNKTGSIGYFWRPAEQKDILRSDRLKDYSMSWLM